jgi:hypothetical protein
MGAQLSVYLYSDNQQEETSVISQARSGSPISESGDSCLTGITIYCRLNPQLIFL